VSNDSWSGGQYSLYRAALGAFVCVHFLSLLPYAAEVFASGGAIAVGSLSPLMGILPNPLALYDGAPAVIALIGSGALCGVLLAIGWFDRVAGVLAALVLAWLYQRNPLIANPSLPLLGWLLILHAFVPPRPYGSVAAMRAGGADPRWELPKHLYVAAWVILALAYTHSGYTKLFSPAWTDGQTIRLVLENPLARDHWLRDIALATPPIVLETLTWAVLFIELLFAPLALLRKLRPGLWLAMLLAQLGFLCFLNFADLTFPMLLAHLITFDPRWVQRKTAPATLYFDGDCAFCHATVRFASMENRNSDIAFAPLQSDEGIAAVQRVPKTWRGDTIILMDDAGHAVKSRAVAGVLERLGGLWSLLGRVLRMIPLAIADRGYDIVGAIRYRLGGRVAVCPLPARR
jgi:predicted DCC family thiol-disulfide oxidoreductase YuxK